MFRQNPCVRQIKLGQKHQNKMNGNTRTGPMCCWAKPAKIVAAVPFFPLTQSGASHKIPKVSTMPTRKGHISLNLNILT